MATASDIITSALYKIEVTTPTTAEVTAGLTNLNNLVSLLGADKMMYSVTSESFTMVVADYEYTIGTSAQWDTTRPIEILDCYLRDGDNFDHPVKVGSYKDYTRLSNKAYVARPSELIYLPEYPLGKIIFNTVPDYAYSVYFQFLKNFTEFAATTETVTLPNEYKEALVYNLAVSLAEDWGREIKPSVVARAVETKEIISRLNASVRKPRKARFEFAGMGGTREGNYDINTDDTIDGGPF